MEDQTRSKDEIEKRLNVMTLVLQTMDAGLWEWEAKTEKLHFDDRCSHMLGYTREELEARIADWRELIHPDNLAEMRATLSDYFQGKTSEFRLEYQCRKKNGEWLWVRTIGKTVAHDAEGRPLRTVGTQLDIHKAKSAEMGLRDYQENLETLILERTRKLEETQSELINKAIEAGRSQLSSMVLHNIGNAITPVKVHIEEMISEDFVKVMDYLEKCYRDLDARKEELTDYVARDKRGREVYGLMGELIETLSEKRRKHLNRLSTINNAISYISEILILQQAYTARAVDSQQMVNLNLLIEDALQMQVSSLEKRQIRLSKHLEKDLPELSINKSRLLQVIINIIKNGYEAIDELNLPDNRMISVKSFQEADGIGFEITDTGIGVDPADISQLFEFGQSGKGSTGIGLYYCKAFAEKYGGRLTFESEGKGKGATVRMVFPL